MRQEYTGESLCNKKIGGVKVRKNVIVFCVILSLVICLVAGSILGAGQKVKLSLWGWFDWQPTVSEFMKLNPDIEVEYVQMGPWDLHDKFLVTLVTGQGAPDIVTLVQARYSVYSSTKQLVDLTTMIGGETSKFDRGALDTVMFQQHIYGLPTDIQPTVIYYRKDLFAAAGIDANKIVTWDDFINAGLRLRADKECYMFPLFIPSGMWGSYWFMMYLASRGVNLWAEDGSVIRDNKLAEQTFQWYVDISKKFKLVLESPWASPSFWMAIKENKVAAIPFNTADSILLKQQVPEQSGKWGVMPWPLWDKNAPKLCGVLGGSAIGIPRQSKYPAEAWKFVKFATTNTKGLKKNWEGAGLYPAYKSAKSQVRQSDPYFSGDSIAQNVEKRVFPSFRFINYAETAIPIGEAIDAAYGGQKTPQQAWHDLIEALVKIGPGKYYNK